MQIKITHNANSVDPSASYDDNTVQSVMDDLAARYIDALQRVYPDADIDVSVGSYIGDGVACSDPDEIDTVRDIVGLVYDTGLFWI
jgi:hypothetical protein